MKEIILKDLSMYIQMCSYKGYKDKEEDEIIKFRIKGTDISKEQINNRRKIDEKFSKSD